MQHSSKFFHPFRWTTVQRLFELYRDEKWLKNWRAHGGWRQWSHSLAAFLLLWVSFANAQGITPIGGGGSGGGSGTVTSIATSCGVSGGTITVSGTISGQITPNPQTGTNYAIVTGDCGKLVNLSNGANQIPTIAQAGTAGFAAGYYVNVCNQGAGTQTITPTTSTIGGAATYVLPAGSAASPNCVGIVSDGTNYQVVPEFTRNVTTTIASGTSALGTSAIASATCAAVVTTTATGTATTDVVLAGFNGDPTAVTGYIPATAGMLTIIGYPTANNVNFKVCNNTSASITPGAITLNWRVER